jgi:tryptophanyl-tRNA synthetase
MLSLAPRCAALAPSLAPSDTYFMVVDLHAITVPHDPVELRSATRAMAATYMAAGIDPVSKGSRIFVQSHVTAHAELQWLLNCATPIGWLNRMIQFKEKARKQVSGWVGGWLGGGVMLTGALPVQYRARLQMADEVCV